MNANSTDILLVEDNPNDVELTLLAFKKHRLSHRAHVARDGVEALDYLFRDGPSAGAQPVDGLKVILLDLKLPRVDGIEVLRRIKDDPRTRSIPVVVLTSSKQDSDIAEAYRLGANSYILKPVDFDRFSQVVQHLGTYWLALNQTASREA